MGTCDYVLEVESIEPDCDPNDVTPGSHELAIGALLDQISSATTEIKIQLAHVGKLPQYRETLRCMENAIDRLDQAVTLAAVQEHPLGNHWYDGRWNAEPREAVRL
jgi:hypothetical protein